MINIYRTAEYFLFNNEKSSDYGVINCNIETGFSEESFLSSREIKSITIKGNDRPYYQYTQLKPLVLNITLFFEDGITSDKLRSLGRLFNQSYFCPISFSDDLNKIYYAMLENDSQLYHNGLSGYVKLQFLCDSAYIYSPIYESQYDLSTNPSGTTIEFINYGDEDCKPIVYIQKIGAGDISIFNLSDSNKEFKFTALSDLEEITVYNDQEIIESSTGLYRYSNFNDNYLSLNRGVNTLNIINACKIKFKYQFKLLV